MAGGGEVEVDAHDPYRKFGFEVFESECVMRRKVPCPYKLGLDMLAYMS